MTEARHVVDLRDRNAFHRALVTALSDPYTNSGDRTKTRLDELSNKGYGEKESYVLDARFELGKSDASYLQSPVLPLQTTDSDAKIPLGMRLEPVFERAHRIGCLQSVVKHLEENLEAEEDNLKESMEHVGFLLSIPEVANAVSKYVKVKDEKRSTGTPSSPGSKPDLDEILRFGSAQDSRIAVNILKGKATDKVEETSKTLVKDILCALLEILTGTKEYKLEGEMGARALKEGLCLYNGVHQLQAGVEEWFGKEVKNPFSDEKVNGLTGVRDYLKNYPRRARKTVDRRTLKEMATYFEGFFNKFEDATDVAAAIEEAKELLKKELPKTRQFDFSFPTLKYVAFPQKDDLKALEKFDCGDSPGQPNGSEKIETEKYEDNFLMWINTSDNSKLELSEAVSLLSVLEAIIKKYKDRGETSLGLEQALFVAQKKIEQIQPLQTCIENIETLQPSRRTDSYVSAVNINESGKFEGYKKTKTGKTRENFELVSYGDKTTDDPSLPYRQLPTDTIRKGSPKLTTGYFRQLVNNAVFNLEEFHKKLEEIKPFKKQLEEESKERGGDDGDDDDDPSGDPVDEHARKRRRSVWGDGLREAALGNDKLYAFARQLGGAIGEPISEVAEIDDSKLVADSREMKAQRRKASQRASEQHMDLVKGVISQVLKDSQLTLGIESDGNGIAGAVSGETIDLGKLKIVSGTLRREAKDLSGLGSSSSTDRFFGNAVRLENLLSAGTGEMTFAQLLESLRLAGQKLQQAANSDVGDFDSMSGAGASIEYLSAPRNSLMLRWRQEALSAVRESFAIFKQEMRNVFTGHVSKEIKAYELIEGSDVELCTLFATLCGLKMANSRLYSSSSSMYVSRFAARANAQQLAVALRRCCRRAVEYLQIRRTMKEGRKTYQN